MDARSLHINIPLPDLSSEDAFEFVEFLYQLAGHFEASYRDSIERYYRNADQYPAEQRYHTLFGTDPAPLQLKLFDDLESF